MKKFLSIGIVFLLLLEVTSAMAQVGGTYDLSWNTVGGGGTMFSTGGGFSLGGTIGNFAAGGPMTGGQYSLTSGFWAGVQPLAVYIPVVRR